MKTNVVLILQFLFIYVNSLRPFQNPYNKKYNKCFNYQLNNKDIKLDKNDNFYLKNFEDLWNDYEKDSNPPINLEEYNKSFTDLKKYDKFIPKNKK